MTASRLPALLAYAMSAQALDPTNAAQSGASLVDSVLALGYEELEAWLSHVPDPERYVTLLLDLSEPVRVAAPDAPRSSREPVPRSGLLFGPFTPDYPPNSGFYGDWLINQLQIQGLLVGSSPNEDRCRIDGANGWADRFEFWDKSKSAADGVETACISASCDPIGIACAIACVPLGSSRRSYANGASTGPTRQTCEPSFSKRPRETTTRRARRGGTPPASRHRGGRRPAPCGRGTGSCPGTTP